MGWSQDEDTLRLAEIEELVGPGCAGPGVVVSRVTIIYKGKETPFSLDLFFF